MTPLELATELHRLLVVLDPSRWHSVTPEQLRADIDVQSAKVKALLAAWPAELANDHALLQDVRHVDFALKSEGLNAQGDFLNLRDALSPLYEALATSLRRRGHRVDSLRPTNYKRTAFHVLSGVIVVAACELIFTQTIAIAVAGFFAVTFWMLEASRRVSPKANEILMSFFKHVARDHERYRVNSSTWYCSALLLIALFMFNEAGMLGILALAFGDPVAGLIGRRFGRVRLMRGKSVEGTLAFLVAASAVGIAYLFLIHRATLSTTSILVMPIAAALGGAVAELLSTRVDDNFTVPVTAGGAAFWFNALFTWL